MGEDIEFTKEGGRYYRAYAFHFTTVAITIPFALAATLLAIINPFWFREAMFLKIERMINRLAYKRNKVMYRIYLGTDPTVWHALKDNH